MAKSRIILTKFWDDEYILEILSNSEKLTYLYLFTNPETTICGIYEISIKTAELRLGIPSEKIRQHLGKFEADGKVIYRKPYIYIKNFIKNQKSNPSILKGIINSFNEIPQKVFQTLNIQKDDFFGNNNDNSLFINGNFRQSVPDSPQSVPDSPQSAAKGIGIGIGIEIEKEIKDKTAQSECEVVQPLSNRCPTVVEPSNQLLDIKSNTYISVFEKIWIQYPNKDGKKDALRHYKNSVKTAKDVSDLQIAVANYLKSPSVLEGYIKKGSTWFNNWRDWIDFKGIIKKETNNKFGGK